MAASDPSWEQDTQGTELGLWPPQTDLVVKNWLDDQRLALMNTDPLYDTLEQVIDVDETYQRQPFDLQDITKKYTNLYNDMRSQVYGMNLNATNNLMALRALNKYFTRKFFIVTGKKITLGRDELGDKLFEKDLKEIYGRGGKKLRRQTKKGRRFISKSKRKQIRRKRTRRSQK